MSKRLKIEVGRKYLFTYPDYGTPDLHPDYTAHSGQMVEVVRPLRDEECDPACQPMFEITSEDGWVGHVHASELGGDPTESEIEVNLSDGTVARWVAEDPLIDKAVAAIEKILGPPTTTKL